MIRAREGRQGAGSSPRYEGCRDIDVVPAHILDEIAHVFEVYKKLEGERIVETLGWFGREEAKGSILEAQKAFEEKFGVGEREWLKRALNGIAERPFLCSSRL